MEVKSSMNILDILLIIVFVIGTLVLMYFMFDSIKDGDGSSITGIFVTWIVFALIIGVIFFRADLKSGSTIGTITSVDRNFFGQSYAIYIKTTETTEEKYCTESDEITWKARDLIGKKVKITYGTRVGFYSTGKCDDAPIDSIEEVE
jgi:glucan phosphoethanolaminetransferase (alkaline phosphatase superfamily)